MHLKSGIWNSTSLAIISLWTKRLHSILSPSNTFQKQWFVSKDKTYLLRRKNKDILQLNSERFGQYPPGSCLFIWQVKWHRWNIWPNNFYQHSLIMTWLIYSWLLLFLNLCQTIVHSLFTFFRNSREGISVAGMFVNNTIKICTWLPSLPKKGYKVFHVS